MNRNKLFHLNRENGINRSIVERARRDSLCFPVFKQSGVFLHIGRPSLVELDSENLSVIYANIVQEQEINLCKECVLVYNKKKLSMSSGLQSFPKVLHNRTALGQHWEGICCIEYLFALNQIEIPFWIRIYQESQTTKSPSCYVE